ncbi:blue copper protein-like [Musa acuminata AAA Group]|uniref:blue copper protein-like n=1 Tax=Musa acuminata AAA Group TaxID=214697 RepID=UPI0031D44F45
MEGVDETRAKLDRMVFFFFFLLCFLFSCGFGSEYCCHGEGMVVAFLVLVACMGLSEGTVQRVGNASTTRSVFEYHKAEHNVVEITLADYQSCNAANPIGVYSTGKDTINIYRTSHRFFICGRAKDCQVGQTVNIRVPEAATSSPPPSVPPSHPPYAPPASGSPASQHAGWSSALAAVVCATIFFLVG